MKLIRFEINGLFERTSTISARLNGDLSILTGRNGAGKTSILKLLWYILSGNIIIALNEIPFSNATIETDLYICTLYKLSSHTCKVELEIKSIGRKYIFEDSFDSENDTYTNAEDEANAYLIKLGSSVFFPTFRRIEGGFTLDAQRHGPGTSVRPTRAKNEIEEALLGLSRRLSHEQHTFVAAISTADIVTLLLRQYADLSDASSKLQQSTSQDIIEKIKSFKIEAATPTVPNKDETQKIDTANYVIDEIRRKIEEMEGERKQIMAPFEVIRTQVERLFKHSGIKMGSRISIGDAASAINSDALSAGEKQMLSFICYNAFYRDSIVFIDEPELSLHVDWQRQLFSTLQSQKSNNQFIIATHSPFIYSKYPDQEVSVDTDRGDEGVSS
jgi:ABC-type lipoprotein export system ATPase subunit